MSSPTPSPRPRGRDVWARRLLTGRGGAALLLVLVVVVVLALRAGLGGGGGEAGGPSGPTPTPGPTGGSSASATPSGGLSAAPSALPTASVPGQQSPGPLPSTTCVPQTTTARLRVVTYNIKSARFEGRSRLDEILTELRALRPDVVLLQEVDKNRPISGRVDEPALLGQGMGYQYAFGLNVLRPGDSQYGTAILSRHQIFDSRNVHLPNRPGLQQRGLLGVSIRVHGIPVDVYDTHLSNVSPAVRLAQITAVTRILAQDPTPKILGGDLNAIPTSPVLARAYQSLSDTWTAVGQGAGHTVPASAPRARIDYLLYQQGRDSSTTITPLSAKVLGVGASDHRGVLATYRLSATAAPVCLPTK